MYYQITLVALSALHLVTYTLNAFDGIPDNNIFLFFISCFLLLCFSCQLIYGKCAVIRRLRNISGCCCCRRRFAQLSDPESDPKMSDANCARVVHRAARNVLQVAAHLSEQQGHHSDGLLVLLRARNAHCIAVHIRL